MIHRDFYPINLSGVRPESERYRSKMRQKSGKCVKQGSKSETGGTRAHLVPRITCTAHETAHAIGSGNAIAYGSDGLTGFGTRWTGDTRRRNRIIAAKRAARAACHRLGRLRAHDTMLLDDPRIDAEHGFLHVNPIAYDTAYEAFRRTGYGSEGRGDHAART